MDKNTQFSSCHIFLSIDIPGKQQSQLFSMDGMPVLVWTRVCPGNFPDCWLMLEGSYHCGFVPSSLDRWAWAWLENSWQGRGSTSFPHNLLPLFWCRPVQSLIVIISLTISLFSKTGIVPNSKLPSSLFLSKLYSLNFFLDHLLPFTVGLALKVTGVPQMHLVLKFHQEIN